MTPTTETAANIDDPSHEGEALDMDDSNEEWNVPPAYDPAAVSRVLAADIQIVNIELLGAHFERTDDDDPVPSFVNEPPKPPELGISRPDWKHDVEAGKLGCIFTFVTSFPDKHDAEPYELIARFRLTYSLTPDIELAESDVNQFVHWNAVFNAWPYWREYLTSTVNRAGLPRFTAPVMGVPRQEQG